MKKIIRNRYVSWTIRGLLCFVAVGLIVGFSFLQGMFYANRRATVRIANDNCFSAWLALKTMDDPANVKTRTLFDREMDASAMKLAEMSLDHPDLILRRHYNILRKFRAYREERGRSHQGIDGIDFAEVDRKVDEAIAYLESIHNMDGWKTWKVVTDSDGNMKVEMER